jgi:hypothetical protein
VCISFLLVQCEKLLITSTVPYSFFSRSTVCLDYAESQVLTASSDWSMSGPEGDEETPESVSSHATALQDGPGDPACPFGYDSFGAMDLSSCASSKAHDTDDNEDAEDEEGGDEEEEEASSSDSGKRGPKRLDGGQRSSGKRKWREEEDSSDRGGSGTEGEEDSGDKSMQSLPPKIRNKRRNIKSVMEEERLEAETKAAKAEEQERLTRLAEQQKQLYLEVS